MILDDLLDRFFFIVGDDAANPREFSRARAIDLINEGNSQFRRAVEDEYYRVDMGAVSGQHTYTLPGVNVRVQRIAFDDYTMRPRTVQEIVALDDKWETRTRQDPFEWTTQGVGHDEFRAYPTPTVTSDAAITQTGEAGEITRWTESGTDATFSSEFGVITRIEDANVSQFTGEFGHVQSISQTNVKQFTIWGTKKAKALAEGGETIPVKNAYQKVGLWYALWHTYEEEGDHHNRVLAGFYRSRFKGEVERGKDRAARPLPWLVVKIGQRRGNSSRRAYLPFSSEMTTDAGTIQVGWPRKGYWG